MEENIERFWHRAYLNLEKGYKRACIDRAYLDFCRTLTLGSYSVGEWSGIREVLSEILLKRIELLLASKMVNQEEFDQWHQTTIMHLVSGEDIDKFISPTKYLTVGQAQKWINMTLKYMYAVGEKYIPNALANYTYYHVPIDSIIQTKLAKSGVAPLSMAWSKLNEMVRYELYQKECRAAFPSEIMIEVEMKFFNQITST